jgi:predicted dehydrogenase
MNRLNVAIVGCGGIARERHIPCWLKNRKTKIVAVCDINESKVKFIAEKLRISGYTNYIEMLDNETIDIVDVVVPTKLHGRIAIAAIQKGKNVVIEKPMAASVEEARKILDLAKIKGVKLSIFHTMKVYPIVPYIKNMIEKKQIGEELFLHFLTSCGRMQPWVMQEGGKLWEVGLHRIYLTNYWFGKIRKVKVYTYNEGLEKNLTLTLFCQEGLSEIHLLDSEYATETITIHGKKKDSNYS